jgi:hypothetical protein
LRFLWCALTALAISLPAQAREVRDGALLLRLCLSADKLDEHMCNGYLLGVWDTVAFYQRTKVMPMLVCYPGVVANRDELRSAVIKHLGDHPGVQEYDAPSATVAALMATWPCPVPKGQR